MGARHRLAVWLALLLCMIPAPGRALCQRNEPGFLWNYVGDMDSRLRIRMTLVFAGSEITGRYTYATRLRDIELTGRLADGRTLILDELDGAGKPAARFTGEFVERDPRGIYGDSRLACEVIVGSWRKAGSSSPMPFYLRSVDATQGSLAHRYGAAGASSDERIHREATRFWEAIRRDDRAAVAGQVAYPITLTIDGGKRTLRSVGDFIRHYEAIVTPKTRRAILDDLPRYMFVRDEGIMLAGGIVWFGADGRVISLAPLR